MSIDEAFNSALRASKRAESARKDWRVAILSFVKWLCVKHPDMGVWRQVERGILEEYLDDLSALSENSRRLRLQPICQTDRYMNRRHGYPRTTEGLSLGRALKKPVATVYLCDVLELVATAPPEIAAGIALQGLAGLRLQETYRLTWDRIDFGRGLVEISGHVKTTWSERVIPAPTVVLDNLRRVPMQKVLDVSKPPRIFGQYKTWEGYSEAVRRAIRRWNCKVTWESKDLRKALPTWAAANGHAGPILEQYLGHAPTGVTARHYVPRLASVTHGEEAELERAMAQFRMQIVDPLESWMAGEEKKRRATLTPDHSRSATAVPTQ